jgi:serine/threonine protein phosphatase 1
MKTGVVNTLGRPTGPYGRNIPSDWICNGGKETLYSYKADEKTFDLDVFLNHIEWMKDLPYYLEFKNVKNEKGEHLLVTHASASRVWHWSDERREQDARTFRANLVWNRAPNIRPISNIYNVFGHTPVAGGPRIRSCYANVDTGCFYMHEPGYGLLSAISFPSMKVYQQENIDVK